jgi:para-aminobenzoate synthetase component I
MSRKPHIQTIPWPSHLESLADLVSEEPYTFLFETVAPHSERHRYSILATQPTKTSTSMEEVERDLQSRHYESPEISALPFVGGWMGLLSYEGKARFAQFESVLIHDHFQQRLHYVSLEQRKRDNINDLLARLKQEESPLPDVIPLPTVSPTITKEDYLAAIQKIKNYIYEGDCYQVNFAQKFVATTYHTPFSLYQRLRSLSPAPYAAYLNYGDLHILSSSPECFLKMNHRHIETHPIKGTRKRALEKNEDRNLKEELWNSSKDQAELLMITDLERNDLGRVCQPGGVVVKELRRIESFPQVHHALSTITGTLTETCSHLKALQACFPGGSITGAPKVRAMEIIRELEPVPRGVYTGALGYLSYHGQSQFNIAIRTMIMENETVSFHVGGGIVADSDPEMEYEETLIKAQGMLLALNLVGGVTGDPTSCSADQAVSSAVGWSRDRTHQIKD